jgi:carbon monoxide dehydrogenase subunit G
VITWRYLNNGVFDLLGNLTPVYDNTSYLISAISSIISPSYATYTQSGTASVKNVDDPAAQITLTGSGNFAGSSVTSPSITVTPATFTANWEYSDGGQYVSLPQGGLNPTYDQKTYTIRVEGGTTPIITPSYATYTGPTGTVSVTNVADPAAQLTLTGSGNFLGSVVTSPSIAVTPATFTVTWHYTTDGGTSYYDLQNPFTSPYNQNTYTISPKIITPLHASHTQSGTASVTNVSDPAAQLTLTGSGNFTGVVTSPSITVTPATFTVTTWKFTHNGTTSDLTNNLFFPPDGSPYTISFIPIPADATYTPSGNASVTNVADGAAQLTLTGSGNFTGVVTSPSITMVQNIYNQNGDGQSFSVQDPPTWSASGPYDPKVFGKFTVTGGEVAVLVQAETLYTVDGVNYLDSLTYDKNVPLYLYFYTSTFFYATADIVAHVTFPATPDPAPALSTFIFPTPVTLSPSTTTTYFAIWSQILIPPNSPVPSQGGNPNLTMKITNNNDPNQIWQWLGTLSGTLS